MKKYRKMLNDINAPYLQSLMRVIETQSAVTLARWCIDYSRARILPIYEKHFPNDPRPKNTLDVADKFLAGVVKLQDVKNAVKNECAAAIGDADAHPAALAAARTCGQAAATIYTPTHSLGLALYGALAVAYDESGIDADWETLVSAAAGECAKMEAALQSIAVKNEPKPAKINWNC